MRRGLLLPVLAIGCATTAARPAGPPPSSPPSSPAASAAPPAPKPAAPPTRGAPSDADVARYKQLLENALALGKQHDLDGALRALGEAKQLVPDEPTAYLAAGLMYYGAGRTPAAAAEFKRSIELMPGDESKKMALEQIKNATERTRDPEEQKLIQLAYEAVEAHKPERALPHLQKALDLNPRNVRTRFEIGYAFVELGRMDEAIPQFEEARRINPVSREVLSELQYCYAERHRFTEMAGVVTDRILVEGESPGLLQELGYSYAQQGNTTVAIATFEDNLTRHPAFYLSHFPLGQMYCKDRRDVGKGRAHLEAFIKQGEVDRRKPEINAALISHPKLDETLRDANQLLQTCR
jgi:tetratricopeptide (TPR) repeat protein